MNLLNDWVSESLLYAIGWTLVHSLWQLILIGAVLWLVLRVFHKSSPSFKYNLALGGLGLSLLFAIATFVYEITSFSPTPLVDRIAFEGMVLSEVQVSAGLGAEGLIKMLINWIELQLPLLVNFWFLGALLFLFRLFNSLSEIRTLRKSSSDPQDFQLEKMLYRLMEKMNVSSNVEIKLTSYGVSPVTFGYLKPIILIPAALVLQLTPVQLEAIIAHELAHVKRNDYLANLLQSALEVLFFYHPCYWWMNQTVKELRENAADDVAVKAGVSPRELAYSLAEVLNFAKQNPPELALAASKKRNPTLQRIKRILGHPAQTYPQNPIISIPMLLTLLLSAGLMATAQQDVPVSIEKTKPLSVNVNNNVNPVVELNRVVEVDENVNINLDVNSNVNVSADTIISKSDTIIVKNSTKGSYVYQHNGKTIVLENMPDLVLTPMPPFPVEAMAPVMDFEMAPIPPMTFEMAPMMDFDMGSMPAMDFDMGSMPAMDFMVSPPVFAFETNSFSSEDTINMTKTEKEKWVKDMEQKAKEYAAKMEEWENTMKPKMEAYEKKVAEWQKEYEPHMEAFEKKMAEWQKAFEPKMKEFEMKMQEWQKTQEPKVEEFEAKMKVWQDSNEPKMKEFEEKMKAWEKEMQPKMEEYQRKMELWQKENAAKIEEYQKKLEEELKKKDDNK
ncbi:M56 family metallopeptidase [Algoriphagus sp. D3-2-R+10]|uniref:M56 family metallopeptidase n=1 Tax=Algoriphagus aurantiacus TaxID=3103948 RepID=UPI002B3E8B2D|nr:M56 family metallopeptidase [Algoriphagus sp. D3-2-R+10]MEB2776094.1 M56 family metallopeptidase [Algoriphagus sp. D3-2-R+10]